MQPAVFCCFPKSILNYVVDVMFDLYDYVQLDLTGRNTTGPP